MKPIEIHIEGYKIVISKDEEIETAKENEKIVYAPCPLPKDYLNEPFKCNDNIILTNTAKS